MGKHGVLVWDRIFEGGKAKSAVELARIGNAGTGAGGGLGGVGGQRWGLWGEQESCWQLRRVWGVGGKTLLIGEDPPPVAAWGVQHLPFFPPWKAPPDDQGCRGREADDVKVRCRLWHDEYV